MAIELKTIKSQLIVWKQINSTNLYQLIINFTFEIRCKNINKI